MKKWSRYLFIVALLPFIINSELISQTNIALPDETFSQINKYIVQRINLPDGRVVVAMIAPSPPTPPAGFKRTAVDLSKLGQTKLINILSGVPAFDWSFGCSATSAAMIAGYYDRHGYINMYTGPTNLGIMPLDNSSWPDWHDGSAWRHQCPLSATHNGLDGRLIDGHVDDYWISYGSTGPDPWVSDPPEHTYGDCTGDYMKTNQWFASQGFNNDASTVFYNFPDGALLTWSDMVDYGIHIYDGGYGLKLFYESRGYTVTNMYNQYRLGHNGVTQGFTYAQYCAEIDAGRPVMIHVVGHTMVGVGYDDATNLMYIHDTWDYNTHTMTWGGSYAGMDHTGVTIVQLEEHEITFTNGDDVSLNYIQTSPAPPLDNWPFGQFSLNSNYAGAILDTVTVDLNGSYSGLSGANPFLLFASDVDDFSSATAVGSDAAASGGSVMFSSIADTLPFGLRYYWITVDLSGSAGGTISGNVANSAALKILYGNIDVSSGYGDLNTGSDVSLPVELSSFVAESFDGSVLLNWITESEIENLGFILERKAQEEMEWQTISDYNTNENLIGQGNSSSQSNYSYIDDEVVFGNVYEYRIADVSYAGAITYLKTIQIKYAEDFLPKKYTLKNAYPNPFNPSTNFKYGLPKDSEVKITIFDIKGSKVKTLINSSKKAGWYDIQWYGTNEQNIKVSSGMYLYKMSAGNFTQVKKILLIR